jgi:hypothetical protein
MGFLLFAFTLLALTFVGLGLARSARERRDAALSEASGGWRIRAEVPMPVGDPFARFDGFQLNPPFNVMEGTEDGFEVAYFEVSQGRRHRQRWHCAIVLLPVDPPKFDGAEPPVAPAGMGPAAADVFQGLGGVRVATAYYALMVRSTGAQQLSVHRAALRLAKAIVTDANAAAAALRS